MPDGKGEPIVKPTKKSVLKAFRDRGGVNTQIITYITVEQWSKHKKEGYLQLYKRTKR